MSLEQITALNDPRLAPYRNLKDRELARIGDQFIAEGYHVVQRLLRSDFATASVLVDERKVRLIEGLAPPAVPVYVAAAGLLNQVVGYKFHAGVLAVGVRKSGPTLDQIMGSAPGPVMLVICPDSRATENLGSIIRTSAGFGANAVVLGEQSCDPFYRRTVRVSMGTVFSIPIVRSENLLAELRTLKEKWGVELIASVLDQRAEPLKAVKRPRRVGILFGSEDQGLSAEFMHIADRRVTVPMELGTDSLNVAIAAGIFLYHFSAGCGD